MQRQTVHSHNQPQETLKNVYIFKYQGNVLIVVKIYNTEINVNQNLRTQMTKILNKSTSDRHLNNYTGDKVNQIT